MNALLERAREAADLPPTRPRQPLFLDVVHGRIERIGSIEPAIADRIARARLGLRATGAGYLVGAPADVALAAIARWLHEQGVAAHWRDEMLAVTDEHGRNVGIVER